MERDNAPQDDIGIRRQLAEATDRLTHRLGMIADARTLWRWEWERIEATVDDDKSPYWLESSHWLSLPNLRRLAELDGKALTAEFGLAFHEFGETTGNALLNRGWYLRDDQPPDVQALMDALGKLSAFVLLALTRSDLDSVSNELLSHLEHVGLSAARVWKPKDPSSLWTKAWLCKRLGISPGAFDKLRGTDIAHGPRGDTTYTYSLDDLTLMASRARAVLPIAGERVEPELKRLIAEALV